MEMVLSNGFCEISQDEMMEIEGGAWWDVVGNIAAGICTVGASVLGISNPVGATATVAALIWTCR